MKLFPYVYGMASMYAEWSAASSRKLYVYEEFFRMPETAA